MHLSIKYYSWKYEICTRRGQVRVFNVHIQSSARLSRADSSVLDRNRYRDYILIYGMGII